MFDLVFENPSFVVADKAAAVLTVPSRFEADDRRPVLGRELEKALSARLFPVHRLDFEVSGLVLFAKTAAAHREAGRWFEQRIVRKIYQGLSGERSFSHWPDKLPAATEEIPENEPVLWTSRILRGKRRSYEHPKGDRAETLATQAGRNSAGELQWLLEPKTGRAHQLRFEMSRHGFPLLGDILYGASEPWIKEEAGAPGAAVPEAIALRAVSLDFSGVSESARQGLPPILEVKGLFP